MGDFGHRCLGLALLCLVAVLPAAAHPPLYVRVAPFVATGCTTSTLDTRLCPAALSAVVVPIPEPGTPVVADLKHWGWKVHLFREGAGANVAIRILNADGQRLEHTVAVLSDPTKRVENAEFPLVELSEPFRTLLNGSYTIELRCSPIPTANAAPARCWGSVWLYYHQ
jgi:hypothetical protein